jgi:hypothetical protein
MIGKALDLLGPVPAPSTTRNAPGIERSAGPNIFADPAPGSTIRMQVMPANAMASRRWVLHRRHKPHQAIGDAIQRIPQPVDPPGGFNVRNAARFDVNSVSLDVGNPETFGKYTSRLPSSA